MQLEHNFIGDKLELNGEIASYKSIEEFLAKGDINMRCRFLVDKFNKYLPGARSLDLESVVKLFTYSMYARLIPVDKATDELRLAFKQAREILKQFI